MKKLIGFLIFAAFLNWGNLEARRRRSVVGVQLEIKEFRIVKIHMSTICEALNAPDDCEKVKNAKGLLESIDGRPSLFMMALASDTSVLIKKVVNVVLRCPRFVEGLTDQKCLTDQQRSLLVESVSEALKQDSQWIRPMMQERDAAYVIILIILLAIARIDVTKKVLKAPYDFTVWVLEKGYKMSNEIFVFLRERVFKKKKIRYRRKVVQRPLEEEEEIEGAEHEKVV